MNGYEPIGAEKIPELRAELLEALRRLVAKARDRDYEVRIAVLETLSECAAELHKLLYQAVHDRDELVRTTAMEIAGEYPAARLGIETVERLAKDRSPLVRSAAAIAIADMSGRDQINPTNALLKGLKQQPNEEVMASIYYGLAKLGVSRYFGLFLKGLKHPFYRIRTATANLLPGVIEPKQRTVVLKALREALGAEDTVAAREAIENAIEEITLSRVS